MKRPPALVRLVSLVAVVAAVLLASIVPFRRAALFDLNAAPTAHALCWRCVPPGGGRCSSSTCWRQSDWARARLPAQGDARTPPATCALLTAIAFVGPLLVAPVGLPVLEALVQMARAEALWPAGRESFREATPGCAGGRYILTLNIPGQAATAESRIGAGGASVSQRLARGTTS